MNAATFFDIVYRAEWASSPASSRPVLNPRIFVNVNPNSVPIGGVVDVVQVTNALYDKLTESVYPLTAVQRSEKLPCSYFSVEPYSPLDLTPSQFVAMVVASLGDLCVERNASCFSTSARCPMEELMPTYVDSRVYDRVAPNEGRAKTCVVRVQLTSRKRGA